jgi:hypothetical protein
VSPTLEHCLNSEEHEATKESDDAEVSEEKAPKEQRRGERFRRANTRLHGPEWL